MASSTDDNVVAEQFIERMYWLFIFWCISTHNCDSGMYALRIPMLMLLYFKTSNCDACL